ncbi:hypothetical protein [Sciscionella sediminilitoris]|uniref:hypothetical protein n=1 Tax=Sciscionella sediminilitoris TaxID=1445613 RepID=UPI0004DF147C|nr:hypothetical protein [Sciscionella sp. SE31]
MNADIPDYRWAGWSNSELAREIRAMRSGKGVDSLSLAIGNLFEAAQAMAAIEDKLRTQLGKLGVVWGAGLAAEQAGATLGGAAEHASQGNARTEAMRAGLDHTTESFVRTRNGMPDPDELDGPAEKGMQTIVTGSGDWTRAAQRSHEARQRAVDGLTGYTDASRTSVAQSESTDDREPRQQGGGSGFDAAAAVAGIGGGAAGVAGLQGRGEQVVYGKDRGPAQPLTGRGEPDEDHVRRFAVEDTDLFSEERPVAPPVLEGPVEEDQKDERA